MHRNGEETMRYTPQITSPDTPDLDVLAIVIGSLSALAIVVMIAIAICGFMERQRQARTARISTVAEFLREQDRTRHSPLINAGYSGRGAKGEEYLWVVLDGQDYEITIRLNQKTNAVEILVPTRIVADIIHVSLQMWGVRQSAMHPEDATAREPWPAVVVPDDNPVVPLQAVA